MHSLVYFGVLLAVLISNVNCTVNKVSLVDGVVNTVTGSLGQSIFHAGIVENAITPCSTLHQTITAPVLPPVTIPIIPKLTKVKPHFIEVARPTLASVVIPIPPVKPVAVLPPAPVMTYMEIPLPRAKPFKVPIIPKLPPIKYMEVELPAPAPLRIPVLPKPAPPQFVQIELPKIKPIKLAPLPKMKPLVLPTMPKIEFPVISIPQPIPVQTIHTRVVPCAHAQVMPLQCPCSSCMNTYASPCMNSYAPPMYHSYLNGYHNVPVMHHGSYYPQSYAPQAYAGYQKTHHTSYTGLQSRHTNYIAHNPHGALLTSGYQQFPQVLRQADNRISTSPAVPSPEGVNRQSNSNELIIELDLSDSNSTTAS